MVEALPHPFDPTQLLPPEPFLPELPSPPVGLGEAGALLDAHHVLDAVALQPAEEAGPPKAPIRQHDRAKPAGNASMTANSASCSSRFWLLSAGKRSRS